MINSKRFEIERLEQIQKVCSKILSLHFNATYGQSEIDELQKLAIYFDDSIGGNVDLMRKHFEKFERYKRRSDKELNLARCKYQIHSISRVVSAMLETLRNS